MAVPSGGEKRNTSGGAFTATTEGGTILGNTSTGTVITKALALKDNAAAWADGTLPRVLADGLQAKQKAYTAGTFAYSAAGKYVIAASSTTLSGVANTKILITGQGSSLNAINQFKHSYGMKSVTAFRYGRFSWTHTTRAGASMASRINWLNVASGGMDSASMPAALNENMWDPVAGATAYESDSAANPTRAIPGELVMKADFVTLTVASGGDFFDYKAITGM